MRETATMAPDVRAAVLEKLKQIPLFAPLSDRPEAMHRLLDICRVRNVAKGQTIIREGDVGSELFVVYTGAVEVTKRTRAGDSYTVVRLRAEYNVFIGEMALIDDDKRSATVVATEESSLIVITKEQFLALGNAEPSIGLPITRELAKILASRLRKTTGDMLTIFDALVNEIEQ